jgi:hypothetical protein
MVSVIDLPTQAAAVAIGAEELGISETEDTVLAGLRRMRPGMVLAAVAFLLSGAEGRGDPTEHWPFVHRLFGGTPLASRLAELEHDSGMSRSLIVPRPLLRIAQLSVLQGLKSKIMTPASLVRDDLLKIVEWSLVLADHYREATARKRPTSFGPDEIALELARFHWLSQPPSIGDVDRAHAVLLEHLSPSAHERVDAALEEVYGVTLEELWTALVIEWLRASAGTGTIPPIIGPWPASGMDKARFESARNSIRQDVAQLKELVAADTALDTPWQFMAFRNRPVTRTDNGVDLVVRPAFVGEKATLTGMFHLIGAAYRHKYGDAQYGSYAGEVGMAVDRRCRELIADATPETARVIWEDELSATVTSDSRKTCDAVWIMGRRWVAMDFVHRQPSMAAQATGDVEDLAKELRLSVVEKLYQVDETLHRLLSSARDQDYDRPNEVLPVIVNGAGSPVMGIVATVMMESLRKERWRTFGHDSRVLQPAVIGLDDLERAAALAKAGKANLGSLLARWKRSRLATASFSYWLWYQRDRGALPQVTMPRSPSEAALRRFIENA